MILNIIAIIKKVEDYAANLQASQTGEEDPSELI